MKIILWTTSLASFTLARIPSHRERNLHSTDHRCYDGCVWSIWGQELQGTQTAENFGVSVSLSRSGYVLAVGAERYNGVGRAQVYFRDRELGQWVQRGEDIMGEDGWFGTSVDLSDDGTRVVVGGWEQPGTVKVFKWNDYEWEQMGSTLTGSEWFSQFGKNVRISGDGKSIIVGDPSMGERLAGAAYVFAYSEDANEWVQVGRDLNARTAGDQYGASVDINGDGTVVAIGGPFNERNGFNAGHVRVFKLDEEDEWRPMGSDLEGEQAGDNFGYAVSISSDGSDLVVGARERLDTPDGARQGYVEAFHFDDETGNWIAQGQKVHGTDVDTEFGHTVAISNDGSKMIAGTPYYRDSMPAFSM